MVCRQNSCQKFVGETSKFYGHSHQRQHFTTLGILLLELLERLSGELRVGFHSVALNESREYSQPRRLEEPKLEW